MLNYRLLSVAMLFLSAVAGARAAPIEQIDEASVRAIETRWSEAFITGDAAVLDALLDPSYVSIGTNGKARPKTEIIAIATSYAAKHPGQHAEPLPASSTVELIGNAAVVRHRSDNDVSIDIFSYEGNQWRARYSQHTAIAPAP